MHAAPALARGCVLAGSSCMLCSFFFARQHEQHEHEHTRKQGNKGESFPDRIFIKQEYQEDDLVNHDDIMWLLLRFGSQHAYAVCNLRLIYPFYCSFYYSFYYAAVCMLLQRSSAIRGCVLGLHFVFFSFYCSFYYAAVCMLL